MRARANAYVGEHGRLIISTVTVLHDERIRALDYDLPLPCGRPTHRRFASSGSAVLPADPLAG